MGNWIFNRIYIGSDHAGFTLKKFLKINVSPEEWIDVGPDSDSSVDYPDYAHSLIHQFLSDSKDAVGVLICGSGQGMAMTANKYPQIRAALCWDEESARLAREHNDANVLCLSARLIGQDLNLGILETFLSTPFAGGRHQKRVDKISKL
ncbi:MAG: ribose 5-phosphate isomerase B [Bdellovibrionales bacterium]|nr:ribose 5-phosphate isomerase B [Bdellovibrionales bacterium]